MAELATAWVLQNDTVASAIGLSLVAPAAALAAGAAAAMVTG
jgi:hypothetical protein